MSVAICRSPWRGRFNSFTVTFIACYTWKEQKVYQLSSQESSHKQQSWPFDKGPTARSCHKDECLTDNAHLEVDSRSKLFEVILCCFLKVFDFKYSLIEYPSITMLARKDMSRTRTPRKSRRQKLKPRHSLLERKTISNKYNCLHGRSQCHMQPRRKWPSSLPGNYQVRFLLRKSQPASSCQGEGMVWPYPSKWSL